VINNYPSTTSFIGRVRVNNKELLLDVCPAVCRFARIYQLGSQWRDFHEIWYWRVLRKSVKKLQILNSDKIIGHFSGRLKCVSYCSFKTIVQKTLSCASNLKPSIIIKLFTAFLGFHDNNGNFKGATKSHCKYSFYIFIEVSCNCRNKYGLFFQVLSTG